MNPFRQLVEGFDDAALFLLGLDGRIETWNSGARRISQYTADEVIGQSVAMLYSAEARWSGEPEHDLAMALNNGRWEQDRWHTRKDGTMFQARIRLEVLEGRVGFSSLTRDITERRQAELESEDRIRQLLEGVEDCGIFMLDPAGHIRSWNAGAAKIKGYEASEILGRNFSVFYLPEEVEARVPQNELEAARRTGKCEAEGWRVRKDGSLFWGHVIITVLRDRAGELSGFSKVTLDLTERKAAEEALKRSEARFAGIVRISEDAIISVDAEQRITLFNEGAEKIFGYPAAEIIGEPIDLLIPLRFARVHRGHVTNFGKSPDALRAMNERGAIYGLRRDGTEFPAEASISRFEVGGETVLTVRLRDVTERKRIDDALRRSEARFATIIRISEDAIITLDETHAVTLFNEGAEKIFGYSWEEVLGNKIGRLLPGNVEVLLTEQTGPISIFGLRKDRSQFPAEVSISQFDVAGEHVVAIRLRDITDRRRAEERIQQSLEEKEVLLKEIHHRVKNNLQVVSSLLSLEAGSPRVAGARELFLESQNRVASMALLHEKLYQSNDFSNINFADYLNSLTHILLDSYGVDPGRISLQLDVDVKLGIHSAVPCGLIVNELLSNCLKHAFPDGRSGNIVLRMHEADQRRVLYFADDGVGMPEGFDIRKSESLGLQLVTTLTRQIGGAFRRLPGPGTGFEMDFPAAEPKPVQAAIAAEA